MSDGDEARFFAHFVYYSSDDKEVLMSLGRI